MKGWRAIMKKTILLVDDSDVIKRIVRSAIVQLGIELLEASDGAEALTIIKKKYDSINLILMDWNMPKMNGFDLLSTLKANKVYQHIPVIMVTTESGKGNIVKAMQAGAKNYILKPFETAELVKKIMQVPGMLD
jgi:two-component system, chemotaxis family, chemotaxis protein CheY